MTAMTGPTIGPDRVRLEAALIERLPKVLAQVREGLSTHWPDYADFLDSNQTGVADAAAPFIHRLVEISQSAPTAVGADGPDSGSQFRDASVHLVFEQVGRQHLLSGHDLTRLLTAFQLGARVAWQHVSATALDMGMPPNSLAALADAVFVFVNQLSFSAAHGYLQAQAEDSRRRERSREDLAELLLSGTPSIVAVRAAATRIGWRVPDRVALALVDPDDEIARAVVDRLGPSCLPVRRRDVYGAIVPDPETDVGRASLARQLAGANAAVGYAVAPERLPRSIEFLQMVGDLRRRGVISGDPVFADEHLDTIIVWRDPSLIAALRRQALAPLNEVADTTRERLVETLTSWLRCQGNHRSMAEELSIHPQTVRYRLHQLRELFGDALDEPRSRARLFLALSWPEDSEPLNRREPGRALRT